MCGMSRGAVLVVAVVAVVVGQGPLQQAKWFRAELLLAF